MKDVRTEEMLLNMGPQHPSTHGVFRVVIRTDGEMVLESESHVGYLHRCFEKVAENDLRDGGFASPVICGGQLFLRTSRYLYCIAEPMTETEVSGAEL